MEKARYIKQSKLGNFIANQCFHAVITLDFGSESLSLSEPLLLSAFLLKAFLLTLAAPDSELSLVLVPLSLGSVDLTELPAFLLRLEASATGSLND